MLLKLMLAVPSYKEAVHDGLQDQAINIATMCQRSQFMAEQAAQGKPADRLVLPSKQPLGFVFAARMSISTCSIELSRNRILWLAEKNAIDWVLMCDSDTWLPRLEQAWAALGMIADAHRDGAAVVAAPVLRRDGLYNALAEVDGKLAPETLPRHLFAGKRVEVNRIGAAFMALNVAWFREKWPWKPTDPWFRMSLIDKDGPPDVVSEDHWLCDGVRARGGAVLADGRIEPIHHGAPYPLPVAALAPSAVVTVH